MIANERDQKESLERQEQKFADEKQRLQQDCNKRIAEIAENAQDEAIKYENNNKCTWTTFCLCYRTLDENGRSIFKENVGLIKSLHIYKQELADLQQVTDDKGINNSLMKEKVEEVQKQNKIIRGVSLSMVNQLNIAGGFRFS